MNSELQAERSSQCPVRGDQEISPVGLGGRSAIVFVLQRLASGGAEKQLLLTARYLAEAGYSCFIFPFVPSEGHARIARLLHDAVTAGATIVPPTMDSVLKQFLRLASFLRGTGPGIVWSWGARADLFCKLAVLRRKDIKLICSLRDANEEWLNRYAPAHRFLASRVDRWMSNTWLNAEMLEKITPRSLPRCRVVYNCLEQEELARPPLDLRKRPDRLEVVMLGNIHPHKKGYDHVVELAAMIKQENLPIHISIAGREDSQNWMQSRIAEQQLSSVLTYNGEAFDPLQFLRRGHAFLLASRQEGTPNALLEAMNLGLPCVSTRVGDIVRLTSDGVNIRQVDVGDVSGMLHALKAFLTDWNRAVQMGMAGRELCAKLFTPQRMIRDTIQVLEELHRSTAVLRPDLS